MKFQVGDLLIDIDDDPVSVGYIQKIFKDELARDALEMIWVDGRENHKKIWHSIEDCWCVEGFINGGKWEHYPR